jgi:LPXTG-site transpeptidase (sortase) family protein
MPLINKKTFITFALFICISVASGSASAAGFTFTRDLTVGSNGADVSALQQFLIDTGFLKNGPPTNYFGPMTKTALIAWQTAVGISPAVGYFGSISKERITTVPPQTTIVPITPPIVVATTTASVATTTVIAVTTHNGSPVRLTIPKLNVDASFQYNGLKSDGTMEIPNNIYDAGWYTGSPRPGEKGNAIITGHVAQIRRSVVTKQGVFYNLSKLLPGDNLFVINDKGETTTFVVRESRLYDPAADATDVFVAKDNGAHLVLITCEGTWNQAQLSYSQRLVIFADAVQ